MMILEVHNILENDDAARSEGAHGNQTKSRQLGHETVMHSHQNSHPWRSMAETKALER
jgi:hypothetical protein